MISRLQKRLGPSSHFGKEPAAVSEEKKKEEYEKLHSKFDYDNANLNKLTDKELGMHKANMD